MAVVFADVAGPLATGGRDEARPNSGCIENLVAENADLVIGSGRPNAVDWRIFCDRRQTYFRNSVNDLHLSKLWIGRAFLDNVVCDATGHPLNRILPRRSRRPLPNHRFGLPIAKLASANGRGTVQSGIRPIRYRIVRRENGRRCACRRG